MTSVRLRRTREDDLDFVLDAEHREENRAFIVPWPRERHAAALRAEDLAHLVAAGAADGGRVGYVILAGLAGTGLSVELRRIVITEKGRGYGRAAARLVKRLAFEELGAHRLWLDVKEHNRRARRLYESEGFVAEGVLRECLRTEAGFESLVVMSVLWGEYEGTARVDEPDGR